MCEFAYGGKKQQAGTAETTASSTRAAAPAAGAVHPPKQQSYGSRRRQVAPSAGFTAGAESDEVVTGNGSAEPEVELAELMELDG
eukprot:3907529-Pleurochrysis_carterae.AAC.1